MKKELLIYSFSIAINRGAILLYMPLVVSTFSVADFGRFSYVQLLIQLIFPIVSLNLSASISREGADNVNVGAYIYRKYYSYIFAFIMLFSFCLYLFPYEIKFKYLILFSILLGGLEALHNMELSLFRVFNKHYIYSFLTILKTFGFGIITLFFYFFNLGDIFIFISCQVAWYLVVFIVFHVYLIKSSLLEFQEYISNRIILGYSLLLLPHLIAQWILSSSNRLIVQHYLGFEELGVFNIAFTIGMLILLLNSGIAIVLPQNFFQRFQYWIDGSVRRKYFLIYSFFVVSLQLFIFLLLRINSDYYLVYAFNDYPVELVFLLVSSGFYLLGFYFYFVNVLFYYRKSFLISLITLVVTIISLFFSVLFTIKFGSLGTSFAVFLSYLIYYFMTMFFSFRICKELKFNWFTDLILPIGFILLGFLGFYFL